MPLPQKKFREIVFQSLFSSIYNSESQEDGVVFLSNLLKTTKKNIRLAIERSLKIVERLEIIDKMIKENSTSYEFERIRLIELSCLRLGLYEMLYDEEIPEKVAISEAIRICKKFSTGETASFINGILGNIQKELVSI